MFLSAINFIIHHTDSLTEPGAYQLTYWLDSEPSGSLSLCLSALEFKHILRHRIFYMDARNLNLGPHASKANNLCSEEFPNLLFCFHQWFNTNNKCPFTWLPGWKELRHLDCLEEHWASSSYYYFYYKPLGGVCTQLSHRFVENQDVSFIVLNLKYALRASRIKLGNRLYQRA